MSHVRQQIREAAATAVTGLTTTSTRVYQSRLNPLNPVNLPCLLVNTDGEQLGATSIGMPSLMERQMELSIRAVAKVTANLDDTLDTMAAEVEVALGNTTLGGLVHYLVLDSIEVEMNGDGDKSVGIATLKYIANYITVANAPSTAL